MGEVQIIVGHYDDEMQLQNNLSSERCLGFDGDQAYPNDNNNEHGPDKHHDGPLEPWLAVLRAETYFCQIPHKVAVPRELLADSRADRMIVEGGVCEKGSKNGTRREVCGRKVAVETDIFWYTLHNQHGAISYAADY